MKEKDNGSIRQWCRDPALHRFARPAFTRITLSFESEAGKKTRFQYADVEKISESRHLWVLEV